MRIIKITPDLLKCYLNIHIQPALFPSKITYECNKCVYRSNDMSQLRVHYVRRHSILKFQYYCPSCSVPLDSIKSLICHIKLFHCDFNVTSFIEYKTQFTKCTLTCKGLVSG